MTKSEVPDDKKPRGIILHSPNLERFVQEEDMLFRNSAVARRRATHKIEHIFCAVDFSKEPEEAFQKALDMSKSIGARLSCYYVYDIRKVYFPGATDQSLASLEKQFHKKFKKFLTKFDLSLSDVKPRFNINDKLNNSAEKTYTQAVDDEADLIIIGTKGQPGTVISLLGNITENLMHIDTEIPVMIIKNRNNKGFWRLFGS